jgi:hypothetical protein
MIEISAEEYENLQNTLKTRDRQIAAYKMREHNTKVTGHVEPKSQPKPEEHKHEEAKPPETEKAPHYVGPWQKFCPTCGDQNPDFQDETECKDCHTHLGAAKNIKTPENPDGKLVVCPNCGGHRAKLIK